MEKLKKYVATGTVTYKFKDWCCAHSEAEAMRVIGDDINTAELDEENPDVYFERVEEEEGEPVYMSPQDEQEYRF